MTPVKDGPRCDGTWAWALTCLGWVSLKGIPSAADLGCRQRGPGAICCIGKGRAERGWLPVDGDSCCCCCWVEVVLAELVMMGTGWLPGWGALGLKCNVGLMLRTFMSTWWELFALNRQLLSLLLWGLNLCWLVGEGLETLSWGKVVVKEWVFREGVQLLIPEGGAWWWWSKELGCCWLAAICFSCSAWDISGQHGMALLAWVAFCDVLAEEVVVSVKQGPAEAGRSCSDPLWTWTKSGDCSIFIGLSTGEHKLAGAPAELGRPKSKPNASSCFSIFSNSRSFSVGTVFVSSSNRSWSSGSICPPPSSLKSKIISALEWPQDWTSIGSFFISFKVILNLSDPTPPWWTMKFFLCVFMAEDACRAWGWVRLWLQDPCPRFPVSTHNRLKFDPGKPQESPFCFCTCPGKCPSIFLLRDPWSWKRHKRQKESIIKTRRKDTVERRCDVASMSLTIIAPCRHFTVEIK